MDPITITTTVITLAAFIKDLIDVGQNIKRSIEKVGENRRRIRGLVDDILGTLAQLANLSRGHEDSFHVQELLNALGDLKADMLHVLSVAKKISAPEPRSGFRGLQSQIKGWLERDDIEAQVKHLNKHVKKCYIQFTAFSAARIEHASARIENTSVRVEQRLIVNSVEQQAKLQHLEGMMARMLVHTQFGQNVVNQTMEIIASDPRHRTLESQYLSVQVMRLLDSLEKCTTAHLFHAKTPYWDPIKPLPLIFLRPTSKAGVLHNILGVVLQIKHSPTQLSLRDIANMLLNLGVKLSSLGVQSEAKASDTFSVKLFRYLASGENGVGALPQFADALCKLSRRYRYELRHDLAVDASRQSVELCHFLSESAPDVDNRVLFLTASNIHSSNLRAAGQIDAAMSVARDALGICRSLLPKTLEFASTRPDWASQYPEYEFQAGQCAESFFYLSRALSGASRHREAFLTSKEGLEVVARFAGAIPPPSGSDIDAFFNHMCNMAEAGELDVNFLADVVILYNNLSHIYPQKFSKAFLLVLYARAYFSNPQAVAIRDLRLFLEPSSGSPPPIMDDFSTSAPWIDDEVVESIIHARYALKSHLGLDVIQCFIAHLIQTHFGIAIQVLRRKVSSLIMEPVVDWATCQSTVYYTHGAFSDYSSWRVLADLVDYSRKSIDFSLSSPMNWSFNNFLWNYCSILLQTPGLSDALAITEDAVRYNLSRTTPPTTKVDWLRLQALVLADMGRFAEAETVLHDAEKRWNSPKPHWLLTVVKSSILRQTGRVDQALLLLENSTSSIANGTSAIVTQRMHWRLYFLFSDLSSTQLDVGQTQNALETAEKAVIKCRELQLSHPHTVQPWIAVAYALSNCLAAVGRTDEGLRAGQEAAAIYAGPLWRGFYPWGYRPQEFASKAYHTLSLRLATSRHPGEALINAEKAVEEYRKLVFLAVRHTPSLASGLQNLASRLWDVDRRNDSITTLKEAISLLRRVVDQLPHHLPALADALEQLAEYLSAQGDVAGASAAASECAVIQERLTHLPVSVEGEAEAESDSEFWDAEEGSGSTCEEIVQGAALAVAAHSEQELRLGEIAPIQADSEEIVRSPLEAQVAGVSPMPESETSSPGLAQEGGAVKEQAEELRIEKVRDIGTRFEMKIELKGSPLDVVWCVLVAVLGAGLALALARK
ncbi:hypothetical protein C8J57DRAFT_1532037 [Mycena rebaudengoi]|nr:hypothetical protein C8J57DRAFT_1532037 [Mycena rebaudengoi]